jgi:hypothetical protein
MLEDLSEGSGAEDDLDEGSDEEVDMGSDDDMEDPRAARSRLTPCSRHVG